MPQLTMSDFYLNGYQQPYFFVFLLGQIIGDTGSKSITMNKKTAPILVLLSIITLLSTLLYSCESNMKPAYVGTWVSYDSSDFKEESGKVMRRIWNIGESDMTITYGGKDNIVTEFIDGATINGNMTIFSQFMTMRVNTASIYNPETKEWASYKKGDLKFIETLEENYLDTLNKFSFKVVKNALVIEQEDDTLYILHRQ